MKTFFTWLLITIGIMSPTTPPEEVIFTEPESVTEESSETLTLEEIFSNEQNVETAESEIATESKLESIPVKQELPIELPVEVPATPTEVIIDEQPVAEPEEEFYENTIEYKTQRFIETVDEYKDEHDSIVRKIDNAYEDYIDWRLDSSVTDSYFDSVDGILEYQNLLDAKIDDFESFLEEMEEKHEDLNEEYLDKYEHPRYSKLEISPEDYVYQVSSSTYSVYTYIPVSTMSVLGGTTNSSLYDFYGYDCLTYSCEGHKAGWNWAIDNYISSEYLCSGYSQSFIEGCFAYVEYGYPYSNYEY